MKKIEEKYTQLCMESSDINEHLPVLKRYAEECSHITEMGTRYVVSTWAFLFGKPNKLTCYDILIGLDMNIVNQRLSELEESAKEIGVDFTFTKGDVLALDIEETDLLFIDTYHEYNQIKRVSLVSYGYVHIYIYIYIYMLGLFYNTIHTAM
jgi:hypothetical protein